MSDTEKRAAVITECDEILVTARALFVAEVVKRGGLDRELTLKQALATQQISINSLMLAKQFHVAVGTFINWELKSRELSTEAFAFCEKESI